MSALLARSAALGTPSVRSIGARAARRPAPFSSQKRLVTVKAAAPEAEPAAEAEELFDVELEELLDQVTYAVEGPDEDFELTDEDVAIIEQALEVEEDALSIPTDLAAAVAADMDDEDEEKATAAAVAEALTLQKLLVGAEEDLEEAELDDLAAMAMEGVDADAVDVDVEDVVAGTGADRFIEAPLTPMESAMVAPMKLSKGELRSLVPQDWDQINIDFFSNKKEQDIPLPEFRLNVLWTPQNVAVAVDQVYSRGQVSPLTEYFFWPRTDSWEDLKASLEQRPWISQRDQILLLNRLTQLINFWQDESVKRTVEEARQEFPDCVFMSG